MNSTRVKVFNHKAQVLMLANMLGFKFSRESERNGKFKLPQCHMKSYFLQAREKERDR